MGVLTISKIGALAPGFVTRIESYLDEPSFEERKQFICPRKIQTATPECVLQNLGKNSSVAVFPLSSHPSISLPLNVVTCPFLGEFSADLAGLPDLMKSDDFADDNTNKVECVGKSFLSELEH